MDRRWISLWIAFGIFVSTLQVVDAWTPEYNLKTALFANYNAQVRPVSWTNWPIYVYIDFFPINLKSVNEREQTVTFNGFLFLTWQDVFLTWNSTLYSGLTTFNIDPKIIWTPPMGLYNSVGKYYDADAAAGLYAKVHSHGQVERQMLGEFTFTCDMDPTNFPYDSHICGMEFSSPSMTTTEMVVYPIRSPVNMELYNKNGQWDIRNSSAIRDQMAPVVAGGLKYDRVTFNFQLARMNMFHMLNIVVPLILTILLVPCLFLLPAEAGEKLGLGVTLLLALSVFLLTLSDSTPETSAYVPLLTIFVTMQLVITATAIICTTFILKLHHNDSPKRPPKWARTFVLSYMARCLCLGDQRKDETMEGTPVKPIVKNSLQNLKDEVKRDDEFLGMSTGNRKLLQYLEVMAKKVKDEEEASEVSDEWKRIAYVLDWICFWIFTLAILIAMIVIFAKGSAGGAASLQET